MTAGPRDGTTTLAEAVEALVKVAEAASLPGEAARAEGLSLAATIAESATGVTEAWHQATGGHSQDFFDRAVRGRRWRSGPTTLLEQLVAHGSEHRLRYAEALVEVTSAACSLGEPSMRVIANASAAAAAQLRAAGARTAPDALARPDQVMAERQPSRRHTPVSPAQPGSAAAAAAPAGPAAAGPTAEQEPQPSLEELLAELDALTGLERVKREVHRQVAILKVDRMRTEAGLRSPTITRHLVFVGNPGTGKTTVARLVGGIYRALGLLSAGQLVEIDRSELVAGYLGQTAVKTAEVVASAAGGVLFIDEAYSLTGDQYGEEAVNTLVKEMEDRRDDLVVIVAGYPEPMATFIAANPGLESRFRTTITFEDYTDDELVGIVTSLAAKSDYDLAEDAVTRFRELLAATPRGPSFGNGRFARNMLEAAIGRQAWRLRDVGAPTTEQLRRLEHRDLEDREDFAEGLPAGGPTGQTEVPGEDRREAPTVPAGGAPRSPASTEEHGPEQRGDHR